MDYINSSDKIMVSKMCLQLHIVSESEMKPSIQRRWKSLLLDWIHSSHPLHLKKPRHSNIWGNQKLAS
jgi:hypothetical protein